MDDICIVTPAERRRRWSEAEKLAMLAEVDVAGGVAAVARRHGIARSVLYNRRSQLRAAASLRPPGVVDFMAIGVINDEPGPGTADPARPGDASHTRPSAGQQILRSFAALPAERDLCSRRARS